MKIFTKIIAKECRNHECHEFQKIKPKESTALCEECSEPMFPIKKPRYSVLICLLIFFLFVIVGGIGNQLDWHPFLLKSRQGFGSREWILLGLKGNLYFLAPGTERLPVFQEIEPVGSVYATSLNVPSREFSEGFPGVTSRFEWFAIEYTGIFLIDIPGVYRFRLTSDDGSRLIIDKQIIIDNDGLHSPQSREGSVELQQGIHSVRIEYFQGPRTRVALVLESAEEGKPYRIFHMAEMGLLRFSTYWVVIFLATLFGLICIVPLLGLWRKFHKHQHLPAL